jgi:hypothetical protein
MSKDCYLYIKKAINQIPTTGSLSMRILAGAFLLLLTSIPVFSQTASNSYPGGARNWSALTWTTGGGGVAPTTNNGTYTEALSIATISTGDNLTTDISFTLNGDLTISSSGSNPTITVPAGVTVIINGNLTDNDNNVVFVVNGTLIVTGTLKGKNNAVFGGSGSISGGTLDLGNGASCSGSCPSLSFTTCTQGDSFCTTNVNTSKTYTWTGTGGSVWTSSGNWTPARTSPSSTDILIFGSGPSNTNINTVPSQTLGQILVTGSSTYTFTPSSNGLALSLTKTSGNALQIDNGSTLSIGVSAGNSLGISMASGEKAAIGGQLNLRNGNFDVSNATLILHTNSAPLARINGQVSANSGTIIKFGDTGYTSGNTITLPNSIFVSSPTVSSITVNRTNGATLGDQSITVSTGATFTLGDFTTNAAGRIKFANTASSPTESASSKIIGYAEMSLRTVGTGAINFLGFNMGTGVNDVGSMSIIRRTGSSGTNTFNSSQSVASTWDVAVGNEPTSGRSVSFSWQSAFDNVTTSSNKFQDYIFNSGPGWTALGSSQFLAAVGPPRQTASVTTTKLTDTFTVTDNTQTLPIELISFSAQPTFSAVNLFWKTVSEKNNDFFVLERMTTGNEFKAIAQLKGAGNSLTELSYFVVDEKPNVGVNYYRLKQVDFDGKFTYSKVISADFNGKVNDEVTIYPNPSDGILNFENLNEDATVFLNDSRGLVLFSRTVKVDAPSVHLMEYNLAAGIYFVRIINSKGSQVKKLMIR